MVTGTIYLADMKNDDGDVQLLGFCSCSMAGHKSQLPGSFGYYDQDASTFAAWKVRASLRCSSCGARILSLDSPCLY